MNDVCPDVHVFVLWVVCERRVGEQYGHSYVCSWIVSDVVICSMSVMFDIRQ